MKKKEKNEEIKCDIQDIIGVLKEGSNWTKAVMNISWFDNAPTVDIRSVNLGVEPPRLGKGISLSNEEADKLVSVLLDNGYGSLDELEAAVTKRRRVFSVLEEDINSIYSDDDEPMNIDCG